MKDFTILTHGYAFVQDGAAKALLDKNVLDLTEVQKERLLWWEGYCDGSFQPSKGMMGVGGVLLDPYGKVSGVFSESNVVSGDEPAASSRAEYQAVIKLLSMARDKGISKLIIKLDSKGVSRALTAHSPSPNGSAMQPFINQAKQLERQFDQVVFQWIPRVKNRQADSLARSGIPDIVPENAKPFVRRPPPSPKTTSLSMMDVGYTSSIVQRHPGVKVIDQQYFLATNSSGKNKALNKWIASPTLRFHTEHGTGGDGVASGVQLNLHADQGAWVYVDKRSSPSLAELRLVIKLLGRLQKAGVDSFLIESSNQSLCLMLAGLKKPPPHLKSAVFTFWDKCEAFSSIGVRHRASVPPWAELLETLPRKQGLGFDVYPEGFDSPAVSHLDVVYDNASQLVISRITHQGQEMFSAKLAKTDDDIPFLVARSLARHMEYSKARGYHQMKIGLGLKEVYEDLVYGAPRSGFIKSDWQQVLKQASTVSFETHLLSAPEQDHIVQMAKGRIPKPFERAPSKIEQWKSGGRSVESKAKPTKRFHP